MKLHLSLIQPICGCCLQPFGGYVYTDHELAPKRHVCRECHDNGIRARAQLAASDIYPCTTSKVKERAQ